MYQYLQSRPMSQSDPFGLFASVDILAATTTVAAMATAGPSDWITGALSALVSEYALNQTEDISWSSEWSDGDNWHSRGDDSWIMLALLQGWYDSFEIRVPFTDIAYNPLEDALLYPGAGDIPLAAGTRKTAPGRGRGVGGLRGVTAVTLMSHNNIARMLKQAGYKVHSHCIDRLRGVGPKPDVSRMRSLGIRNMGDVCEILRKGKRGTKDNGLVAIVHGQAQVVMNPRNRMLITIDHAKR